MPAYSYNSGVLRATSELASGIIPEHLIASSAHFPGIPTIFRSPEIIPDALHFGDARPMLPCTGDPKNGIGRPRNVSVQMALGKPELGLTPL